MDKTNFDHLCLFRLCMLPVNKQQEIQLSLTGRVQHHQRQEHNSSVI